MQKPSLSVVLLLAAPTVIASGLAFTLMNWRSPTHVQLHLATDHLIFRVSGEEPTQLLNTVAVHSITIQNYSRLELHPDHAAFADPADFSTSDKLPESAWKPLSIAAPVIITSGDASLQPSITLEASLPSTTPAGTLDQLWAKPSTQVTVDTADPSAPRATIKLNGQSTSAILSLPNTFNLFSDYGKITGLDYPLATHDSQALQFHLPPSNPQAQITGAGNSLALFLTLPTDKPTSIFSTNNTPVDAIDLTRQSALGSVESSIVGKSDITYPDDPKAETITLEPSQFLTLGNLKKFRIEKIELDTSTHSLHVIADGIAGIIHTGTAEFPQDRRITYFDRIWHNPQLTLLFSIVVWIFPTTIAGYKLYKEVTA